ncbi:MAG: hypothetical protein ACTSX8_00375 [Alphaproteobacteria bacterium]
MTDAVSTPTEPTAPAEGMPATKSARVRVPLKEWGPQLPLGIVGTDGKLHRNVSWRAWTGVEEREIGHIREATKEDGSFLTALIAHMFTQVGPHDFSSMEDAAKRVVVSQMFLGDALYLYLWLRTKTLGPALQTAVTCPFCKFEFDYEADLNTVEVRTAESIESAGWDHQLHHPFKIRGVEVQGFELAPTHWSTMEMIVKNAIQNQDTTKMDMIRGSVRRILGQESGIALVDNELDGMTKLDIETLASKLDEREIGPDLSISDKCSRCKRTFYVSLDWKYDSFFGVSSPSTV